MRWQDVSGWLFDSEGAALQEVCRGKVVLEIGSWKGRSTCCIATVARHVTTIEHFQADDSIRKYYPAPTPPDAVRLELQRNLIACGVQDKVTVVDAMWEDVLDATNHTASDTQPDVVFYDADHHWKSIQRFLQRVEDFRGTLCIHDYGKKEPEWAFATKLIDGFVYGSDKLRVSRNLPATPVRQLRVVGSLAIITMP